MNRSPAVTREVDTLIVSLAAELQVEARALRAVVLVETPGYGLVAGRPIIRLEINRLWLTVPRELRGRVDERFHVRGPQPWEGHMWRPIPRSDSWIPLHQGGSAGQSLEWQALHVARDIHRQAADEATSWGIGQVMGWHWGDLGYPSLDRFLSEQERLQGQVETFRRFLVTNGLLDALRARDWLGFARAYNGAANAVHYSGELAEAYDQQGG